MKAIRIPKRMAAMSELMLMRALAFQNYGAHVDLSGEPESVLQKRMLFRPLFRVRFWGPGGKPFSKPRCNA